MAELDGSVGGGGADPVLAPVITSTGWSAMAREVIYAARPWRSSTQQQPASRTCLRGRPLRELLPEAVPSVGAARGLDPVHGAEAAGRRPDRLPVVHALTRDGPRAAKLTVPDPETGGGDWLRVGEARIGGGRRPRVHRRRHWMGPGARGGRGAAVPFAGGVDVPRAAAAHEAAVAGAGRALLGSLTVDGRSIDVDGWRGMAGHNWGAQHAERWIWLHGLTEDGDWLDAGIGRDEARAGHDAVGGNGALSVAGDRHLLRRAKVPSSRTGARSRCRAAAWRCAERSRRRAAGSWAGCTRTRTGPSITP